MYITCFILRNLKNWRSHYAKSGSVNLLKSVKTRWRQKLNHLPPLLVTVNSTIARRFNIPVVSGKVTKGGKQINISSVALYLSYLFRNGTATIPILHVSSSRPCIAPAVSSNLLKAETPVDPGNLHPPWSASLAYYFPFYPARRERARFLLPRLEKGTLKAF